ncbi:MAG TPA: diguanylate cyclase, partial [Clostridiales bacterium]|nr:diguanylate cyclase [Clostridiales bacterium]
DILKLDMQFVCNETGKPEVQSILGDIVAMGHRLHLGIVAEGAETRGQVDRLKDAGCDYVQGYFFAKPMPLDQFEAHWKARGYACVPPEEK